MTVQYERPPRAVLFDFNGTLNDMDVLMQQNLHMGRELGRSFTSEDVRLSWGRPADEFYAKLYGTSQPWQEWRKQFLSYDHLFTRRLLPHVPETLHVLHAAGIALGVITSGERPIVHRYMDEAGLPKELCRIIYTSPEIAEAKKAGMPVVAKALGELGVHASQAVLVGDEVANMHDALKANTDFIIVASGTRTRDELIDGGVPGERIIPRLGALPAVLGVR